MKLSNKAATGKMILIAGLALIIILIRIFSSNPGWVEQVYASRVYQGFSIFLRLITGWLPLSIGDILYIAAFLWIIRKVWRRLKKWKM